MSELPLKLKEKLNNGEFKKAIPLYALKQRPLIHKVGFTYWCGYWQKSYTVLKKNFYHDKNRKNRFKSVTVLWEDGKETTHMTSLDPKRDYLLLK